MACEEFRIVGPQNLLYKGANPNYAPKRYEEEGLKDYLVTRCCKACISGEGWLWIFSMGIGQSK